MKQKTAIRQLIEYLNETIEVTHIDPKLSGLRAALEVVVKKAQELESVNEQQIKDAYDTGHVEGDSIAWAYKDQEGQQYFNETFEKP